MLELHFQKSKLRHGKTFKTGRAEVLSVDGLVLVLQFLRSVFLRVSVLSVLTP